MFLRICGKHAKSFKTTANKYTRLSLVLEHLLKRKSSFFFFKYKASRWGRCETDIRLTCSLSACLLWVRGDKREGASWLCSQNNRGNDEIGTEQRGSSRQWHEALCGRNSVRRSQTGPRSLHTCKVNPPLPGRCW